MFKLSKVEVTELKNVKDEDKIPYHLTGRKVLHVQGFSGKGVKVAVVDTGCDWNHEALKDNIKDHEKDHNMCGYLGGGMDDDGHGTHVASTIVEIAPDVEIAPYKCLAPYGGENKWVIRALNEIADRDDIDVVNMSISSNMRVGSIDQVALHEVIKRLHAKNVYMVVASGNTGDERELFPACFEEVTTVGAVDINKHEAMFSTLSNHVDVCQVGVELLGAKLGGGYVKYSGTSMATPMISGMVSLLICKYKAQHENIRPEGKFIHAMLKLMAIDLGVSGLDLKTGAGFSTFDPTTSIIKMELGSKEYEVNGKKKLMDVVTYLDEETNRTMVSARFANDGKEVMFTYPIVTIV